MNLAAEGEFGRFPIGISCMLQALKYWLHLQNTNTILLKETLPVSKDLHQDCSRGYHHSLQVYRLEQVAHKLIV